MPWRWILGGMTLGYFIAQVRVPSSITGVVLQLPHAENKAGILAVFAALLLVYLLLIALPLALLARRERTAFLAAHPEGEGSARTSFLKNLRKRGSFGQLEFLGFEIETRKEIVLPPAGSSPG